MFERYTEKARRVVFFARYEASQYGSATIGTEHLLLGLLREDIVLMSRFLGRGGTGPEIRTEIERVITVGKPISTSVEMPLSVECKRILKLAAEEAERLGHRHIGTEHLLLGILGVGDGLAARILNGRGVQAVAIRKQIAMAGPEPAIQERSTISALVALDCFLEGLKEPRGGQLANIFAEKGQFVDSDGKRWSGRKEIVKDAEMLFAPFAKRNATYLVEEVVSGSGEVVIASVLWEFAAGPGEHSKSILRMSIVMAPEGDEWTILLLQVTPVVPDSILHR
jgi:uncharacterized protein (TIGR02246 family)